MIERAGRRQGEHGPGAEADPGKPDVPLDDEAADLATARAERDADPDLPRALADQ
jgi:hypothetical protein